MENNKNKKSVKFQGDMLNFYDFIQVFVFTTNHHLNQYFVHILSPVTDSCPSSISGRRTGSMWPDRVSNSGAQTYESGALPTALRGLGYIWTREESYHRLVS